MSIGIFLFLFLLNGQDTEKIYKFFQIPLHRWSGSRQPHTNFWIFCTVYQLPEIINYYHHNYIFPKIPKFIISDGRLHTIHIANQFIQLIGL